MPKGIDKKLDDTWSLAVKVRDNMKCQYCGKETTLNSHHIYSRSKKSTRWDIENGITLCVSHHTFNSGFSAHKTPLEFIDWLKTQRTEEEIDNLRFKANQSRKWYKHEKEELLKQLEEMILTYKQKCNEQS